MHEISVCRALIREAQAVVHQHAASGVARLCLRLGPLSGVEPALLRSAFAAVAAGTCAQGALLAIETVPLRMRCDACGAHSDAQPNRLVCAACGDWRTRLTSGDELTLATVDLRFDRPQVPHV
jgi:hydrogenase nickel incorporation protein HypA/HybF